MPAFTQIIPILRSFDEHKAKECYLDYLGCTLDWDHRFAPGLPLYFQVSRSGLVLHLSEHHGDATPGSSVHIKMTGLHALHTELHAKRYANLRPGIEDTPWGSWQMALIDPFGNTLRLNEDRPQA